MNNIVLAIILVFSLHSSLSAQFGGLKIKKPKISAPKVKTKKGKTISSTNSSSPTSTPAAESNRNKNGTPKYDPENPTYKTYSKARDNIKFAKSIIEGIEWKQNPEKAQKDALKYLTKAKESLDILNQTDSEKGRDYLKQFNEDYTNFSQKCAADTEKYNKVAKHQETLELYYKWVALGHDINNKEIEKTYKGYYKHRDAFKAEYPDKFAGDYNQKMVSKVDDFFKVKVYEKVENLDKKVSSIIKNIHKVNDGREAYILNADGYVKDFDKPIKSLAYYKDNLLEDLTTANALEAKINKEKGFLEEYISSGKFAENRAKYEQEIIDARLLRKGMSDSKLEAFAKSKLPSKFGKVLRVTVASTDWGVNKNAFDIPVSKGITVDFATKKDDGKCYYVSASVMRTYEGGGKYGNWYFDDPWTKGEMNCNNVNKNK